MPQTKEEKDAEKQRKADELAAKKAALAEEKEKKKAEAEALKAQKAEEAAAKKAKQDEEKAAKKAEADALKAQKAEEAAAKKLAQAEEKEKKAAEAAVKKEEAAAEQAAKKADAKHLKERKAFEDDEKKARAVVNNEQLSAFNFLKMDYKEKTQWAKEKDAARQGQAELDERRAEEKRQKAEAEAKAAAEEQARIEREKNPEKPLKPFSPELQKVLDEIAKRSIAEPDTNFVVLSPEVGMKHWRFLIEGCHKKRAYVANYPEGIKYLQNDKDVKKVVAWLHSDYNPENALGPGFFNKGKYESLTFEGPGWATVKKLYPAFAADCYNLKELDLSGFTSLEVIDANICYENFALETLNLKGCSNLSRVGDFFMAYCHKLKTIVYPSGATSPSFDKGANFLHHCYAIHRAPVVRKNPLPVRQPETTPSAWPPAVEFDKYKEEFLKKAAADPKRNYFLLTMCHLGKGAKLADNAWIANFTDKDSMKFAQDEVDFSVRSTLVLNLHTPPSNKSDGDGENFHYDFLCGLKMKNLVFDGPQWERLEKVQLGFCYECPELEAVDLTQFTNLEKIGNHFCYNCPKLKTVNLSNLPWLEVVDDAFLLGCIGLTDVDLTGTQLTYIGESFLSNTTSLVEFDFGALWPKKGAIPSGFFCKTFSLTTAHNWDLFANQIFRIGSSVFQATGLTKIDLRAFFFVRSVGSKFFYESKVTSVDASNWRRMEDIGPGFLPNNCKITSYPEGFASVVINKVRESGCRAYWDSKEEKVFLDKNNSL